MLAFFETSPIHPAVDLAELAARLGGHGIAVVGAVQRNLDVAQDCHCTMVLDIIGDDGPAIKISQDLGAESTGCRLDAGALELAAGRVTRVLNGADLVILNKFGKQESFGRGMRSVVAAAVEAAIPTLIAVPVEHRAAFDAFAGEFAQQIAPEDAEDWCRLAARLPA